MAARSRIYGWIILLFFAVFFVCSMKSYAESVRTSTEYRFDKKFKKVCRNYQTFARMNKKDYNYAIPGLKATNVNGEECHQMTPQGLTFTEKYILITAYCKKLSHKSVLYVMDRRNGKYLKTLVLEDKNHVGGIAYDGAYIWVAKSKKQALSAISIQTIEDAVFQKRDSVPVKYMRDYTGNPEGNDFFNLENIASASFITYFNDYYWVGYCNGVGDGTLTAYQKVRNDTGGFEFRNCFSVSIPYAANGVCLYKDKESGLTYMMVSVSPGRYWMSQLRIYELLYTKHTAAKLLLKEYSFPNMMEELEINNGLMFSNYESAATCYSSEEHPCKYITDRLTAVSVEELLEFDQ